MRPMYVLLPIFSLFLFDPLGDDASANSLRCEFYLFWNCFVPLFWMPNLNSTALALLGLPPFFCFPFVASFWPGLIRFCAGHRRGCTMAFTFRRQWRQNLAQMSPHYAIKPRNQNARWRQLCALLKQCSPARSLANSLTHSVTRSLRRPPCWQNGGRKLQSQQMRQAAAWQKLTDVSCGVAIAFALSLSFSLLLLDYTFSFELHPASLALFCLLKAAKCLSN